MKAKEAFAALGGTNFMTPSIIRYQDLDNGMLVELSKGRGFDNDPIFGVTVIDATGHQDHEASDMFHSQEEADKHILILGCNHTFVSMKNEVVDSGEVCLTCGKLKLESPEGGDSGDTDTSN